MRGVARPFDERYSRGDGCWVWQDARNSAGYGELMVKGRMWLAHRFAWTRANGPIPQGIFVCHTCDNKLCVRVAHLFLGSPLANTQDMDRKGRRVNAPVRGERQGSAKLTAAQVVEIRTEAARGATLVSLAARHGISDTHAGRIARGESWQHVA